MKHLYNPNKISKLKDMSKEKKSGGAREGSGRKPTYIGKTELLRIVVPKKQKPIIKKMILDFLKPFKTTNK